MSYLLVGLGGGLGAISRFWVGRQVAHRFTMTFPLGTLIINVTGSLLVGVLLGWMLEQTDLGGNWRLLLVIGVLGGYTTFSTFAFESIELIENDQFLRAAGYILISTVASLAVCAVGLAIGRVIAS